MLSGSSESLDQFVEVVAAYEAADGNLQSSISGLSTAASDDRAAIRAEMVTETGVRVAAEAAIQADVDQNEADSDAAHAAATTARNGMIAAAATESAARVAAENAIAAGLAQELLDRAAAEAAIQGDVDQNEADSDAAHAAATTDRALLRTEAGNETAARVAAENAIQADVDANEAAALVARNAIIAQHGIDDGAAATARGVIADALAQELLDRAAADAAEVVARDSAISAAVANLIDSAPGALDTLNELAAAIGDDANYAATVTNTIAGVQADVDQNEADSDAAHAAATTARNGMIAAAATESAARVAAENAIQADVDANEAAALVARNAIIAQHGIDDGAAATARGVIADALAQELLDRAAAVSAEASARITDVDAEETRALGAEAALQGDLNGTKAQLDVAGGFTVASTASSWEMGWGAGKPKVEFSIDAGGAVTMSVVVA
jgi:hypothetical protein